MVIEVILSPRLAERLEELAEQQGVAPSVLAVQLIEAYLTSDDDKSEDGPDARE